MAPEVQSTGVLVWLGHLLWEEQATDPALPSLPLQCHALRVSLRPTDGCKSFQWVVKREMVPPVWNGICCTWNVFQISSGRYGWHRLWLCVCVWVQSRSLSPCSPCLSQLLISPLVVLFKMHGLSYLILGDGNYNSPESGKNALKKKHLNEVCSASMFTYKLTYKMIMKNMSSVYCKQRSNYCKTGHNN